VPVGEQGHQELVDDVVLTHDDLPELLQDAGVALGKPFQFFEIPGFGLCHGFLYRSSG